MRWMELGVMKFLGWSSRGAPRCAKNRRSRSKRVRVQSRTEGDVGIVECRESANAISVVKDREVPSGISVVLTT